MSDDQAPASPASPALPHFDVVFLDLDETLVSWMAPALSKHKTDLQRVIREYRWNPGDGRKVYEILGMTKTKFWSPIDEDPNFWHGLPKLPHCDMLVKLAQSISDAVCILSSPHNHENCFAGKHEWIKQHLPASVGTVLAKQKHLLAAPGRLLIDDQDDKVNAFRSAGGSAILFPQHWNSAHDKAPFGPLFYLAQELEKLRRSLARKSERQVIVNKIRESWRNLPSPAGYDQSRGEWFVAQPAELPADQSIGTQDTSDLPPAWILPPAEHQKLADDFRRALAGKSPDDFRAARIGEPIAPTAPVEATP